MGGHRLRHREKTGRERTDAETFKILAGDGRFRSGWDLNANARSAQERMQEEERELETGFAHERAWRTSESHSLQRRTQVSWRAGW